MGYYTPSAGDTWTAANFKTYVRNQTVNQFASATARDAAIPTPVEGMVCFLADVNGLYYYDGAAWKLVAPQAVGAADATSGTTTSTTFTDTLTGASTLAVSFTAPASGQVVVSVAATMANGGANNVVIGFRLSGASTVAASDARSANMLGASAFRLGASALVTGLTAVGSYTATCQHRTTAGTATYLNREIIVQPA